MKKILLFILIFSIFLPASALAAFNISLKSGSKGNAVIELQNFLKEQGVFSGKIDGKFGPITKKAVIAFQLANGLKGDGSFGPLSRAKANSILASATVVEPPVTEVSLDSDKLVILVPDPVPTNQGTTQPKYPRSSGARGQKKLGSFTIKNDNSTESVKVTGLTVTLTNSASPSNTTWVKAPVDITLAPNARHVIDVYTNTLTSAITIKLDATVAGTSSGVEVGQN